MKNNMLRLSNNLRSLIYNYRKPLFVGYIGGSYINGYLMSKKLGADFKHDKILATADHLLFFIISLLIPIGFIPLCIFMTPRLIIDNIEKLYLEWKETNDSSRM